MKHHPRASRLLSFAIPLLAATATAQLPQTGLAWSTFLGGSGSEIPFTRALRKLMNRVRHYLAQRRDVLWQQPLTEGHGSLVGVAAVYSSMCSPSHGAIAHETAERLERAFDRLPEDYRRVITPVRLGRFMAEDEHRSHSGDVVGEALA